MVIRFTILHHFRKLKDPRINRHKLHLLPDIIVIALCAVLCGATDWQQWTVLIRFASRIVLMSPEETIDGALFDTSVIAPPALLTRMSTGPSFFCTASIAF